MNQRLTGPRALLSWPPAYRAFTHLVGGERARALFVRDHLRPAAGSRILDIGCGAGDLLPFLPEGTYVGFDASPEYVDAARTRFGRRGTFLCGRVEDPSGLPSASFDLAVAFGVLHHLDDAGARRLFSAAKALLTPGGRLVTIDGCWTDGQSHVARWLLARDRGRFVRSPEALRSLGKETFPDVRVAVRGDLLRIPYSHAILECS